MKSSAVVGILVPFDNIPPCLEIAQALKFTDVKHAQIFIRTVRVI